ncbi:MAG: nicotinamide mononucleotide transporter [Bacilli bacterium]|nr:nicotinamide mononucleotide transporter [Bacilli bacterium]
MNIKRSLQSLTKLEWSLWIASLLVIGLSFFMGDISILNIIGSLIGVTALIFISKGNVIGQFLIVIFSILYGIISIAFGYYGEMITYMFMTTPTAILSIISWVKNPYQENEVKVAKVTIKQIIIMFILSIIITAIFYFILKYLNTENLIISTISITTSFIAGYLTYLRSPYYALGYSANDIVLIILWLYATFINITYFPMVLCFVMFLFNDLYGLYNWQKMLKRQNQNK